MKEITRLKARLILNWAQLVAVVFWTVIAIASLVFGLHVQLNDPESDKVFFELRIGGFFDHKE